MPGCERVWAQSAGPAREASEKCATAIESMRSCDCGGVSLGRLAFDAVPQGSAGEPETFRALNSGLQRVAYPEAAGDNQSVGEWLSLVEHLVRDQGVGGSNPLSPTNKSRNIN